MGDAMSDDAGLAAPGTGQNQERTILELDRLALRRIEAL